ncbi:hypothetical protein ACJJTC_016747 [Scirpophaga incertulas]
MKMVPVIYAAVPISVLVAVALLRKWKSRKWGKCLSNTCLKGKTYLITGATSGIGLETTKMLIKRKARVILACRDVAKAKELITEIRQQQPYGGELIPMHLDLASFESIEKFVEIIKAGFYKIDVLINNAGVAIPLARDEKTKEGFEIHFGVNHLGHFYLTKLLLDHLKRASPSRVVIVSSSLHEKGVINFDDLNSKAEIELAKQGKVKSRHISAYQNSKLMNVYFMKGLADRLKGAGVDVSALCPGFCYTNLFRYSIKWYHYIFDAPVFLLFMRSAKQGAETVVYCATEYAIEGQTGKLYKDCAEYDSKYRLTRTSRTNCGKSLNSSSRRENQFL